MINVWCSVPPGGRWSVIMLSMIHAAHRSHLSPYCNESMFRNSNYLFDCVSNDRYTIIYQRAHTHTLSCTRTYVQIQRQPGGRETQIHRHMHTHTHACWCTHTYNVSPTHLLTDRCSKVTSTFDPCCHNSIDPFPWIQPHYVSGEPASQLSKRN